MTSKQVMLTLMATLLAASGCDTVRFGEDPATAQTPPSPYAERQLWAVVPLRNESGSINADGYRLADHLARQFEKVARIDVMPVNRVIAAMESLQLNEVRTPGDARRLANVLHADGLVLGSITAFEPYDPPKIGLAIELYLDPARPMPTVFDTQALQRAAVDEQTRPPVSATAGGPDSAISDFYDAASPDVRDMLAHYAKRRGDKDHDAISVALYRSSIDLYSEFVAHLAASHLLASEYNRLADGSNRPTGGRGP